MQPLQPALRSAVLLGLLVAAGPRPAAPATDPVTQPENPVVARVKKLGGSAKVDDKADGKPVVEINLTSVRITDDDLALLADVPTLRVLHLTQTPVTSKGLEHVRGLKDLEVLTLLNCTKVGDEGMKHLAGLTKLRELWTCASITDKGFAELKGLTEMRDLRLSFGTTDKSLEVVKGFRKLEKLKLFGGYSGVGLKHLSHLPELRELDISMTSIGPDGLDPLKELPKLRVLALGNGGFQSIEKLLPAVRGLKAVEKLSLLGASADGDAELDHLAEMDKLTELDLYGLKLTDQSLEKLAGLKNLTRLGVAGKGITDRGLLKLKALANLRHLQLSGTSVTDKGVDELRKTLTKLGVGRTGF